MLTLTSWTIARSALLLTACAWLVPACGGSAELTNDGGGATGQTAGASSAGTSSAGANSAGASSAGASSAGTSSAGTSSAGGPGSCAAVACPAIACGPGYVMVHEGGSCCGTCVPDGTAGSGGGLNCAAVSCPAIDCAPGYRYEVPKGQCCGTCSPDPQACAAGQKTYQALRRTLLAAPSVRKCSQDTDCQLLPGNGECGDYCPSDYVYTGAVMAISQQLSQFAADNCSSCPPILIPACEPPPPVACVSGSCLAGQ